MSRAYELDPSNPFTATNLSEVLYRRGEYERARFYVRRVNALARCLERADLVARGADREQAEERAGCVMEFGNQLRRSLPRFAGSGAVRA